MPDIYKEAEPNNHMGLWDLFHKKKHRARPRARVKSSGLTQDNFDKLMREIEAIKGFLASHDRKVEASFSDLSMSRGVKLKAQELKAINIIKAHITEGKTRPETIKKILSEKLCSQASAYRLYNREAGKKAIETQVRT